MRLRSRNLVPVTLAAIFLAAVAVAQAETWSLELKRLEPRDRSGRSSDRTDHIIRTTYPQHFFRQIMPDGKSGVRLMGNNQHEATFKKIVKKEPQYNSEQPFKCVAKLGTQEFAFALDTSTPRPEAKDEEPEEDQDNAEAEPKADSPIAKLKEMLTEKIAKKESAPALCVYDRLYFDFNHNGDLTDDEAVAAEVDTGRYSPRQSYARISFPRLDVTIDAGGTPVESSILLSGQTHSSSDISYVNISINAGAYREGEITLDGRKRRVVLVDFNSNGRFDDEMKIHEEVHLSQGQVYPKQGDMLLIDPKRRQGGYDSPYDVTSADYRHNVSKLIGIDGRFYDMKITPAGDELTLEASSVKTGHMTNPNDGFRALIYSDEMFLKISGAKDSPIAVPVGQWKLLSYTINLTEDPKPAEPPEKEAEEGEGETSALKALVDVLKAYIQKPLARPSSRPGWSMVAARGTRDCTAVKVVEGETVELPFGPPYKPLVTAQRYGGREQVHLEMSLVGSAGEICSNLMVHGGRPGKPEFTITDPEGEVVQEGNFEYG